MAWVAVAVGCGPDLSELSGAELVEQLCTGSDPKPALAEVFRRKDPTVARHLGPFLRHPKTEVRLVALTCAEQFSSLLPFTYSVLYRDEVEDREEMDARLEFLDELPPVLLELEEAIIDRLDEKETFMRSGAARTLLMLWARNQPTRPSETALPKLIACMHDDDRNVVYFACAAVAHFRNQGEAALEKLLELSGDSDEGVRFIAMNSAGLVSSEPRVLRTAETLLGDPHPHVRSAAVHALTRAGPDAAFAVDELIGLLDDEDRHVADAAAGAIARADAEHGKAIERLLAQLDTREDKTQWILALGRLSRAERQHNARRF